MVLLSPVLGLQEYVPPPVPLSVVELPRLIVTSEPALAVGPVNTFTVIVAVSVQAPFETTTVYVVVAVGETVSKELVPPVFHEYVPPPVAVRIVEEPAQMLVSPVILATGGAVVLTVTVAVSTHPLASVPITEYEVVVVGVTVIEVETDELLQT